MEDTTLEDNSFGMHLLLDGYGGDETQLNNLPEISTLLETLPEKMGMHIIHGPVVVEAQANDKKDPGGITGFVLIAESHMSFHTFPKRGFVSIDVYSCKDFDYKRLVDTFKQFFQLKDVEVSVIKRGLKYPEANIY